MIRKRKKSGLFKIIFLFFLIFFLFALILFYCFIFLKIKEVNISMNKIDCATDDQFRNIAAIDGQNFLLFNSGKILKNIKGEFICIKNITFSRSFPNKLKVEVIPREAIAELITIEDKQASLSSVENISTPSAEARTDYFLADDEGVVFL